MTRRQEINETFHLARARAWYASGKTLAEIAIDQRCSITTVTRRLSREGVQIRPAGRTPTASTKLDLARARADYAAGHSIRQIASDQGCNHSLVYRCLTGVGVQMRSHRITALEAKLCKLLEKRAK